MTKKNLPHAAEPIRSKNEINRVKLRLLEKENFKFYAIFCVGINTGLRIGDILSLKWDQVLKNGEIRDHIKVKQQKTKKVVEVSLKSIKKVLQELKSKNPDDLYLFQSDHHHAKAIARSKGENVKAYSKQAVYNVLNEYIEGVEYVSTHTLRKSYGALAYRSGIPIAYISERLGHSNVQITQRYLCITADETRKAFENFSL